MVAKRTLGQSFYSSSREGNAVAVLSIRAVLPIVIPSCRWGSRQPEHCRCGRVDFCVSAAAISSRRFAAITVPQSAADECQAPVLDELTAPTLQGDR